MEAVIVVLMIVAVVNFWLKLTFVKPWQVWAFAALAAVFVYAMQPLAIMQSKTQLIDALRNPALMQDIALIISLEVVLEMAFCLWETRYYTHDELRPRTRWIFHLLRFFPGILVFPVLFVVLTNVIFVLPGWNFHLIALLVAVAVILVTITGELVLRHLLPEKSLRLELLFIGNVVVALLGIVATVNGRTAVEGTDKVNWLALVGILAIILVFTLIGMAYYRIMLKRKRDNNQ